MYRQINESQRPLIVEEFGTDLSRDEYYILEVVAESIGVVRVKRMRFSKF